MISTSARTPVRWRSAAARDTRSIATFTAKLIDGDWRMAICLAASWIAVWSEASRPVVATTSGTFRATQAAAIAATAPGREKSMTTSAGQVQPSLMATPAGVPPARVPASVPVRG